MFREANIFGTWETKLINLKIIEYIFNYEEKQKIKITTCS